MSVWRSCTHGEVIDRAGEVRNRLKVVGSELVHAQEEAE